MQRVLLIVNSRAGSVRARTREVIAKALSADFKLEVADTMSRNHASALAADAVDRGFDAVVAFGGDGTVNEAAQTLVGSGLALGVLPGGTTNVLARSLGIPRDPVEATAFVAARLRAGSRRSINVGANNDRYFIFSTGMGLDAEVVKRVEADPDAKAKSAEWTFLRKALAAGVMEYRRMEPSITVHVEGREPTKALFSICCNGRPFTYFKRLPVDACPGASLDGGLDVFSLRKIRLGTVPRIVWAIFVSRSHVRWRTARYDHDIQGVTLTGDRPLPVQVDGDYIGEQREATIRSVPKGLDVLV
ncbi:MAG: diacylglycerol kinase family lipid kinase [Actinomycetota bacterium]|nr:diacylglycerol kinase family lipid kinase [Actinomycetota bacterium]